MLHSFIHSHSTRGRERESLFLSVCLSLVTQQMFIHIFRVVCLFQNVFNRVRRHLFLSLITNLNKNLLIDSSAQRSGSTDFSIDCICNHWHKTIPNWIESSSEKKYDDTSSTKHALYMHRNNFYF